MNDARKTCITVKLPPPVGTSEWETFSRDSLCVDKTRMIKELVVRDPAALRAEGVAVIDARWTTRRCYESIW